MPTNQAIPMTANRNEQNVPMTVQEQGRTVPMAVQSGVIPNVAGKADKVTDATAGNLAGLNSYGNLTDSGYAPGDFIEAPETAGTSGQVLTADGNGGSSWQNMINDSAGAGITSKTWSASKLTTQFIQNRIWKLTYTIPKNNTSSDISHTLTNHQWSGGYSPTFTNNARVIGFDLEQPEYIKNLQFTLSPNMMTGSCKIRPGATAQTMEVYVAELGNI